MKLPEILLFFSLIPGVLNAQMDFDNYRTLQSVGTIPSDFSNQTFEKVKEGMSERREEIGSVSDQREFLEQTGYAIDDLLHSGLVVYGDAVSNYLSAVADNLLIGDEELRSKLRFYTLKSNATNAFSTDQGIIFVTTGLISRLSNEAQLAFILAHEISHYTEKHVVETFTWKKNNQFSSEWVRRMSIYSKDKEFSADVLAVDMYRNAGYAENELIGTFDVLLYSYLPFDDVPINISYFSTEKLFLPKFLFPSRTYEINADPDGEDSLSSHPNIYKRRRAVQKRMDEVTDSWGNEVNTQGDALFYKIRDIARFESVRMDVMQANFGAALYSIYLLEKDFPRSIFLQRMKMQAWLGLYQHKLKSKIWKTVLSDSELEGQSAPIHYFIKNLNRKSLTTMFVRQVYDIYHNNKEDVEINALYEYSLKQLGEDSMFDLEEYSNMSFVQYVDSVLEERKESFDNSKQDTAVTGEPNEITEIFVDSSNYHFYGLSDVLRDSMFLRKLDKYSIKSESTNKKSKGSYDKGFDHNPMYENLKIGVNNFIIVEPRVVDYGRKGIDMTKSEKLEGTFGNAIIFAADQAGVGVNSVDGRNLSTESYNYRSTLFGFLNQFVQEEDMIPFPVDYMELKNITQRVGTSHVMFTLVEHNFNPRISSFALIVSAICWPTFPFTLGTYLPIQLMRGNRTNLSLIVLDVESCELKTGGVFNFHERVSKHNIGSRMYSIFKHMSSLP